MVHRVGNLASYLFHNREGFRKITKKFEKANKELLVAEKKELLALKERELQALLARAAANDSLLLDHQSFDRPTLHSPNL